jgi:hypothetical protein
MLGLGGEPDSHPVTMIDGNPTSIVPLAVWQQAIVTNADTIIISAAKRSEMNKSLHTSSGRSHCSCSKNEYR